MHSYRKKTLALQALSAKQSFAYVTDISEATAEMRYVAFVAASCVRCVACGE